MMTSMCEAKDGLMLQIVAMQQLEEKHDPSYQFTPKWDKEQADRIRKLKANGLCTYEGMRYDNRSGNFIIIFLKLTQKGRRMLTELGGKTYI